MIAAGAALAGCGGSAPPPAAGTRPASDEAGAWYDAETHEIVLQMSPVDLPVGHHGMAHSSRAETVSVPASGWLHGYRVALVGADGRALPRELVHHINLLAPGRRELFSPIMQRVAAAGVETAAVEVPPLFGYPVTRGDSLVLIAALHNPTGREYDNVRVQLRMLYTPADARPRPMAIYPFYLDVTPPAAPHAFDLPPGRSTHSWEGTAAVSGRILMLGGHLHDHGLELRLEDLTEDRTIWRTEPILDENGHVVGMPQTRLFWRLGLSIREGHTYRLTAVYDNDTGRTLPDGGMGALGGILVADADAVWPAIDTTDPVYQEDYRYRIASNGTTRPGAMDDMDMRWMEQDSAVTGASATHMQRETGGG